MWSSWTDRGHGASASVMLAVRLEDMHVTRDRYARDERHRETSQSPVLATLPIPVLTPPLDSHDEALRARERR